ncbi:hypothetical protein [Shewanella woodyi]|uniref:hypothetical protein n=1 Tax=Shewanella woodyi TaxID=60961 RepID=UPI0037497B16
MAVDSMDAVVELTWKYSQRVTEVAAQTSLEAIDKTKGMNANNLPNTKLARS